MRLLQQFGFALLFVYSRGEPITRIAFGSCNKHMISQQYWNVINATQPDLWVWLGVIRALITKDVVYSDRMLAPGIGTSMMQA